MSEVALQAVAVDAAQPCPHSRRAVGQLHAIEVGQVPEVAGEAPAEARHAGILGAACLVDDGGPWGRES